MAPLFSLLAIFPPVVIHGIAAIKAFSPQTIIVKETSVKLFLGLFEPQTRSIKSNSVRSMEVYNCKPFLEPRMMI